MQYPTGPITEHHLTRRSAGLFDIDHMGQISIIGAEATAFLNHLVTCDVAKISPNTSKYGLMCYGNGGIVDDTFVYKLENRWFVVINADNREKDVTWMKQQATEYEVTIQDVSDETYMLALQGPKAVALLQHLTEFDLSNLSRFHATETAVNGVETIIGRTGYTGEDGVELFFPADHALSMWQAILDKGAAVGIEVKPIGLAARDSLRFEPSFPLYGHEIRADITPLEARLSWACAFETDFIGRDALLKQQATGLSRKLVGFEMTQKAVPRQGYPVTQEDGVPVGEVVTGLFAPTVNKYCGHALVSADRAEVGTPLNVVIRGKPKGAVVVKRPFYRPAYR